MSSDARPVDDAEPVSARGLETVTAVGETVTGAVAIVAAVFGYIVFVPLWVYVPASVAGTTNSPAMMPKVYCVALGILGAIVAVRGLALLKTARGTPVIANADWRRVVATLALCAVYLLGIELIGLPFASALALAGAMVLFGERRPAMVAATAFVLPLLLWAFFVKVANVPMPDPIVEIGALGVSTPWA